VRDVTPVDDETRPAPPPAHDLGAFGTDDAADDKSPKGRLKALRLSPRDPGRFRSLLQALEIAPDADLRRQGIAVAARALNPALYADPELVEDFADSREPIAAVQALLDARRRKGDAEFDATIRPALFERLVRCGFGELARPALFHVKQPAPAALAAAPADALRPVRTATAKRILLDDLSNLNAWKDLVDACKATGDPRSARFYARLAASVVEDKAAAAALVKDAGEGEASPQTELSPWRWIRRSPTGSDGHLPAVIGGDGRLYVPGSEWALPCVSDGGAFRPTKRSPGRAVFALPRGAGVVAAGFWRQFDKGSVNTKRVEGATSQLDLASVVSAGDTLYAFDDGLVRIDLTANRVVWRNQAVVAGASGFRSLLGRELPVPDGQDVFVVSGHDLVRLDAATGKQRWSLPCNAAGIPAVVGQRIVIGTGDREVWGVDRKTGRRVWRLLAEGPPHGRITHDGTRAFYATAEGQVGAVNAAGGELLWRRRTDISTDVHAATSAETALLVRNDYLVACNGHGYIEFDARTGSIRRRLAVRTARPLLQMRDLVIVQTRPNRFVAVAPPLHGDVGEPVRAVAKRLVEAGKSKLAGSLLNFVAAFIHPADLTTHEQALEATGRRAPDEARNALALLVGNADVFSARARRLMRDHLDHAPPQPHQAYRLYEVVARAHIERGAVDAAVRAFERLRRARPDTGTLATLMSLQLVAGRSDEALLTGRALAVHGPRAAHSALLVLTDHGLEDEGMRLVAPLAGRREAMPVVFSAVGISGSRGLFHRAGDMLDRSASLLPLSERSIAKAYLLGGAGVADRVLTRTRQGIAKRLALLAAHLERRRRDEQKAGRPEAARATSKRLQRVKTVQFP
jgi:hypothetical protein